MSDDEAVKLWRSRLGGSWDGAWRAFKRFYDEVLVPEFRLSPSGLVDWQVEAVGRDRYRILGLAQDWLNKQPLRYKTKRTRLSFIRSFFMHNRAELPRDGGFRFKGDTPPVEGKLSFEAFRSVLLNCNKMYRAVFLMMAQGLMGEGELLYVNTRLWRVVLENLTKKKGVFKLVIPGRKRNRNVKNFYTLLSAESDFADAFKEYLRSSPHRLSGALFRNTRGEPLTARNIQNYFHSRAVEAGVISQFTPLCSRCHGETVRVRRNHPTGIRKVGYHCQQCGGLDWACDLGTRKSLTSVRYGVNPHEIRDLMRSRWQVSGADPLVAEFMLLHEVDPNAYNKFTKYEQWYPLQEYRKALPWLNVSSCDPNKVDRTVMDEKFEGTHAELEVLRRELGRIRGKLALLDDPEVVETLRRVANKQK